MYIVLLCFVSAAVGYGKTELKASDDLRVSSLGLDFLLMRTKPTILDGVGRVL